MKTSQVISSKIAAARRRHSFVSLVTGASAALLHVSACLGVGLILDWSLELPWIIRAALMLIYALGALAWFGWLAIWPIAHGPDDEEIALAVERYQSTFATRLIAAVQFTKMEAVPAGMHEGMVAALIEQTEVMAKPVKFEHVYPTNRMWQLTAGSLVMLLILAIGVITSEPVGRILLHRAALVNIPLPHATQIDVLHGDQMIVHGDRATIAVEARGVLPEKGFVRLRYASGATQKFDIVPSTDEPSRYELNLDSVMETFTYSVKVNDAWSDREYKITVIDRPEIVSLIVKQICPSYTKLGTIIKHPSDLTLLQGSALLLEIKSSSPLSRKSINGKSSHITLHQLIPASKTTTQSSAETTTNIPLVVDTVDAHKLTCAQPLLIPPGTIGLSVHLVDEAGMENKDPTLYRITLIDDKTPTLRIQSPTERSETVTRRAYIPIAFVATDDFGIAALRMHYRVLQNTGDANKAAAGENEVATTVVDAKDTVIDIDLGTNPLIVTGAYRLQLSKLRPQTVEGDLIEWWIEAIDVNNATGPGRTVSEVYRARVISEIDKRNELLNRFGDTGESFNEMAETEQKLNEKLGGGILNREPEK